VNSLDFDPASAVLRAGTAHGIFALRRPQPPFTCVPGEARACLLGGRFRVELEALRTSEGRRAEGVVVQAGDRHAVFSLPAFTGDPTFAEVAVKMLDPGGPPGYGYWVFHGSLTTAAYVLTVTDSVTGRVETFRNRTENPSCGGAMTSAFVGDETPADPGLDADRRAAAPSRSSGAELLLLGSRFSIVLSAHSARHDRTEEGVAVRGTDRWGYFSLPGFTGDAGFPEVVVKMADFRSLTGGFLVFHAALTGLEYTLTVTDRQTGTVRTLESPGNFCGGVASDNFAPSPPAPLDLRGEWQGLLKLPCYQGCDAREEVRISLAQAGREVTGTLPTRCFGPLPFHGTLDGSQLTVELSHVLAGGDLVGLARSEAIRLEAECNPWEIDGDPITLDLLRIP
jgi:hypothetical protein